MKALSNDYVEAELDCEEWSHIFIYIIGSIRNEGVKVESLYKVKEIMYLRINYQKIISSLMLASNLPFWSYPSSNLVKNNCAKQTNTGCSKGSTFQLPAWTLSNQEIVIANPSEWLNR
jgi:hypothetical protein